jgi:phage terminase large subunit-like protein
VLLGITTAGSMTDSFGRDSLCYRLYQYGIKVATGEVEDPSFYFAWWEPHAGVDADHTDPKVWEEANPGYGTVVAEEDFVATLGRTRENEYRTKRTNVWVTGTETALPFGIWDGLPQCGTPDRGVEVVLAFDGSYSGDSTGIIGATVPPEGGRPQMFVVDLWEKPMEVRDWRVDIAVVEARIEEACRYWHVREVACDPYRWQRSLQALEERGLPMVEWNTSQLPRMVPAWQSFYDIVLDGGIEHDHDPRLARHIGNMVLKTDMRGTRPVKSTTGRKIDLGICAVIAYDRAMAPREREPQVMFY